MTIRIERTGDAIKLAFWQREGIGSTQLDLTIDDLRQFRDLVEATLKMPKCTFEVSI